MGRSRHQPVVDRSSTRRSTSYSEGGKFDETIGFRNEPKGEEHNQWKVPILRQSTLGFVRRPAGKLGQIVENIRYKDLVFQRFLCGCNLLDHSTTILGERIWS